MRWPVAMLLASWLTAGAGCRNCDLVEAELRSRENDMRELRADLAQAEAQNEALMRELQSVRQGSAAKVSPEQASQSYTLKQITLGRQTGGHDNDDCPGDEALQVVIEPRDGDGHTIKAPGSLHVEVLEISPEGLKTPSSTWDISPDQLRRSWRSGFFSTGYILVLPWKTWPASDKLRVVARFTLADGRSFEADKDITIRLTPTGRRKPLPSTPAVEPTLPDPAIPLPPPRKLDPKSMSSSRPWWKAPEIAPAPAQTTVMWRPKQAPSLADAVQLLRPVALTYQPGEDPSP